MTFPCVFLNSNSLFTVLIKLKLPTAGAVDELAIRPKKKRLENSSLFFVGLRLFAAYRRLYLL
jgi:hypothetical protein